MNCFFFFNCTIYFKRIVRRVTCSSRCWTSEDSKAFFKQAISFCNSFFKTKNIPQSNFWPDVSGRKPSGRLSPRAPS